MGSLNLFSQQHTWSLASLLGIRSSFLVVQADIIIHTWIIMGVLIALCLVCRLILHYNNGLFAYAVMQLVDIFVSLCDKTLGFFSAKHCSFIASLFIFIFACNTFAIIPGIEEPTRDLNTALACGLVSFVYIQYEAIKRQGIRAYISSYFKPIFLLFPINVIGRLATLISMSFRLFGNIFGGALITQIYFSAISVHWVLQAVALLSGINILIVGFFTLFEGTLQAFVFMMLTLTYLALVFQDEGGH